MATGADSITDLAAVLGGAIPRPTLDRNARMLREFGRGLWPEAPRGGSKLPAHHVEKQHLANLIISLAAWQPVDAPMTVLALRTLPLVSSRTYAPDPRRPGGIAGEVQDLREVGGAELGTYIANMIDQAADPKFRAAAAGHFLGWELEVCGQPQMGEIRHRTSPGAEIVILFQESQEPLPFSENAPMRRPSRRTAIINYDVILAAGQLWEDTQKRRAVASKGSLLVKAPIPSAQPESENARIAIPTAILALTGYPPGGATQTGS